MIWGCVPTPSPRPSCNQTMIQRVGGASCSLCIRLVMTSNFVTQNTQKRSGPYNFPHRKPTRCLVTFWVFCGWQRTHPQIDLSPALPEEACSLKMSVPPPFQNTDITSWSEALPSQTSSCLRRGLSPTWRLGFLLGKGEEYLLTAEKKPFSWTSARMALLKPTDFKEAGVGLWPRLLPPQEQRNGTMYVKVLCKLQIPGTITCLCMCFCIFKTAASRRDDFSCDTSGNTDFPTAETRGVFLAWAFRE